MAHSLLRLWTQINWIAAISPSRIELKIGRGHRTMCMGVTPEGPNGWLLRPCEFGRRLVARLGTIYYVIRAICEVQG